MSHLGLLDYIWGAQSEFTICLCDAMWHCRKIYEEID